MNASGGLDGHAVQLKYYDDAGNPGTAVSDAHALISAGVDAIADYSIVSQAYASTVQAANIPVVGMDLTNDSYYSNPDFYAEGQTNDTGRFATVLVAKEAGATNFGFLYCAEAPACQEDVGPYKATGQQYGVPMVYSGDIAATAPNYTAQCLAAKQDHVSALVVSDSQTITARVATDCNAQGYDPIYVVPQGVIFSPLFNKTSGMENNTWSPFEDLPYFANTPTLAAMNAAVDKYYPGLRTNTALFSQAAIGGWISGLLLANAVMAGGLTATETPSAAVIVKGLESMKGNTLGGVSVPLTFPAGQPHPIGCWYVGLIKNGVSQLANNGKLTCPNGSSS